MILSKNYNYAVVGASHNREKFGFKVFENLLDRGFNVFPVNPKGGELLGIKVSKNLSLVAKNVDVVIFVTPPEVSLEILKKFNKLALKNAWFQPGSENDKVVNYCESNNIEFVKNSCIIGLSFNDSKS